MKIKKAVFLPSSHHRLIMNSKYITFHKPLKYVMIITNTKYELWWAYRR